MAVEAQPKPKPKTPRLQFIALRLIDEPAAPIRSKMDAEKLEALAESIRAAGMLEPILVELSGERFKVMAGHRRFVAARLAGLELVPAIVYPQGQVTAALISLHENSGREEMNPADEGLWFTELCASQCGNDVDQLCVLLRYKRAYVEERLLLVTGDEDVFAAVQRGELSLAVARELNRYTDQGIRRVRLQAAVEGGATARVVREWRLKDEVLQTAYNQAAGLPAEAPLSPRPPIQSSFVCFICESSEDPADMELLYIHRGCKRVVFKGVQQVQGDHGRQ